MATCVEELVAFCRQKELGVIYWQTILQSSISYCAKELSHSSMAIHKCCTPFAANKVCIELITAKKMHGQYACKPSADVYNIYHVTKTESEYEVNGTMTSCSCTFSRTMLLPCKHLFFARIQAFHESVTVFSEALVTSRWRNDCQVFSVPSESALSFSSKPVNLLKKKTRLHVTVGRVENLYHGICILQNCPSFWWNP